MSGQNQQQILARLASGRRAERPSRFANAIAKLADAYAWYRAQVALGAAA